MQLSYSYETGSISLEINVKESNAGTKGGDKNDAVCKTLQHFLRDINALRNRVILSEEQQPEEKQPEEIEKQDLDVEVNVDDEEDEKAVYQHLDEVVEENLGGDEDRDIDEVDDKNQYRDENSVVDENQDQEENQVGDETQDQEETQVTNENQEDENSVVDENRDQDENQVGDETQDQEENQDQVTNENQEDENSVVDETQDKEENQRADETQDQDENQDQSENIDQDEQAIDQVLDGEPEQDLNSAEENKNQIIEDEDSTEPISDDLINEDVRNSKDEDLSEDKDEYGTENQDQVADESQDQDQSENLEQDEQAIDQVLDGEAEDDQNLVEENGNQIMEDEDHNEPISDDLIEDDERYSKDEDVGEDKEYGSEGVENIETTADEQNLDDTAYEEYISEGSGDKEDAAEGDNELLTLIEKHVDTPRPSWELEKEEEEEEKFSEIIDDIIDNAVEDVTLGGEEVTSQHSERSSATSDIIEKTKDRPSEEKISEGSLKEKKPKKGSMQIIKETRTSILRKQGGSYQNCRGNNFITNCDHLKPKDKCTCKGFTSPDFKADCPVCGRWYRDGAKREEAEKRLNAICRKRPNNNNGCGCCRKNCCCYSGKKELRKIPSRFYSFDRDTSMDFGDSLTEYLTWYR